MTTTEKQGHTPSLRDRVNQFNAMELPGQPMMMHMGTMSLVNDLQRSNDELLAVLKAMVKQHREVTDTIDEVDAPEWFAALRDAEAAIAKATGGEHA